MATEILAHQRALAAVWPPSVNEALEQFSESVEKARLIASKDARTIARDVGAGVREISDHSDRIHNALGAAIKLLDNNTDNDEALALLQLLQASSGQLCNRMYDFAGTALVALELANVCAPTQGAARG